MFLHNRPAPVRAPRKMPTNPKPVLVVTKIPVFRVHHSVLEAYIKTVFGFDFDFMLAAGCVEGVAIDYQVRGEYLGGAWEQRADELRSGKRQKSVPLILNVLVRDSYIPAGLYTVSTHPLPDPTKVYTEIVRRTEDPNHPECLDFKAKHRGDSVFTQRAEILDKAVLEATAK